jgi:hypothetical protein
MPHIKSYEEKFDFIADVKSTPKLFCDTFYKNLFLEKLDAEGQRIIKDGSIELAGKYEIDGREIKLEITFKEHEGKVRVYGTFKCYAPKTKLIVSLLLIPVHGVGLVLLLFFYLLDLMDDKSEYDVLINALEKTTEYIERQQAPVSFQHIQSLKDMTELKEKGVISEEEYERQKAKLLVFFKTDEMEKVVVSEHSEVLDVIEGSEADKSPSSKNFLDIILKTVAWVLAVFLILLGGVGLREGDFKELAVGFIISGVVVSPLFPQAVRRLAKKPIGLIYRAGIIFLTFIGVFVFAVIRA